MDSWRGSSTSVLSLRNLAGFSGLALLGIAVLRIRRNSPQPGRAFLVCCASLMVIAFNWLFHSVWGVDRFLYSQHWDVALKLLFAGVLCASMRPSYRTTVALAGITILVGVNNVYVLRGILSMLRGFW
ncbi:MAG: hypothetical protein ABI634_11055 [Acidobacteriota bacterium]